MGRPLKYDPAVIAQCLADYAAGESMRNISSRTGIPAVTLSRAHRSAQSVTAASPKAKPGPPPGRPRGRPKKKAPPPPPIAAQVVQPAPTPEPDPDADNPPLLPCYVVPDVLDGAADRLMIMEAAKTAAGVMAACRISMAVNAAFPRALQATAAALKDALQVYSVTRGVTLESGAAPVFAHMDANTPSQQVAQAIYFVPSPSIDQIPAAAREALAAFRSQEEPDAQAA